MKLDQIKEDVDHFIKKRSQPGYSSPWPWIYDLQMKYRDERFHGDAILTELEGRFHSTHTRRLWKRDGYEPGNMLLAYAKAQPEEVAQSLNDLLDDHQDLPDRLDRFDFYMDAINARQRDHVPDWHYAWHHQDRSIMSYYLALAYPAQYAFYMEPLHSAIVERYGAKSLEPGLQVDRYQKMARIVGKYLFDALPEGTFRSLFMVNELFLALLGSVADPMADRR